jgi:hypothetical protein
LNNLPWLTAYWQLSFYLIAFNDNICALQYFIIVDDNYYTTLLAYSHARTMPMSQTVGERYTGYTRWGHIFYTEHGLNKPDIMSV